MPQCPQCNKPLRDMPRKCPSCQADLDLLVDYTDQLKIGLEQAERFMRAGELAKAMWAYLAVLEVDPDNPTARRQVGQVATAVRQFDRTAPGRRWLFQLRGEKLPMESSARGRWLWAGAASLVVLLAFALGYLLGVYVELPEGPQPEPPAANQMK